MRKILAVLVLSILGITSVFAYKKMGTNQVICKVGNEYLLYITDFADDTYIFRVLDALGGYQKFINPNLAPDVKKMMKETGSPWCVTIYNNIIYQNFYIKSIDKFCTIVGDAKETWQKGK